MTPTCWWTDTRVCTHTVRCQTRVHTLASGARQEQTQYLRARTDTRTHTHTHTHTSIMRRQTHMEACSCIHTNTVSLMFLDSAAKLTSSLTLSFWPVASKNLSHLFMSNSAAYYAKLHQSCSSIGMWMIACWLSGCLHQLYYAVDTGFRSLFR